MGLHDTFIKSVQKRTNLARIQRTDAGLFHINHPAAYPFRDIGQGFETKKVKKKGGDKKKKKKNLEQWERGVTWSNLGATD